MILFIVTLSLIPGIYAVEFIEEARNLTACYSKESFMPLCPSNLILVGRMLIGRHTDDDLNTCYDSNHSCLCTHPSQTTLDRKCFWRQSFCQFEPSFNVFMTVCCGKLNTPPTYSVCDRCGCVYPNMSIDMSLEPDEIFTKSGFIFSENYPYAYTIPQRRSKIIHLQDSVTSALNLSFLHLDLLHDEDEDDCSYHYVQLLSSKNGKEEEIGKFCKDESMNLITQSSVVVRFVADVGDSPKTGFVIAFDVIPYIESTTVPTTTFSFGNDTEDITSSTTTATTMPSTTPTSNTDTLIIVVSTFSLSIVIFITISIIITLYYLHRKRRDREQNKAIELHTISGKSDCSNGSVYTNSSRNNYYPQNENISYESKSEAQSMKTNMGTKRNVHSSFDKSITHHNGHAVDDFSSFTGSA